MGKMYDTTEAGNVIIKVQYQTSDIQESYVECQVGALIGEDINMSGCFADGENDIKIGDTTYTYTYTAATDNKAGRTVKGFSTSLQEKLRDGPGAPYPDFTYFYDYYGEYTLLLRLSFCLMISFHRTLCSDFKLSLFDTIQQQAHPTMPTNG
jgi:hypothetical protein